MPEGRGGRRYPRTARVNELLREVIAEELERLQDDDPRLAVLAVTHVEATPDLRRAKVLLSSMPEGVADELDRHRLRFQAAIGRQVRLKRTPQLSFEADPAVAKGQQIEDLLRELDRARGRGDADE